MVQYRTFRNDDPPRILALWEQAGLGRGAAGGLTVDAFETLNFSQPYFDPVGLIIAEEGDQLLGFVHAGFGSNADGSALARERGVVCAVIVRPDVRRRGIGRELVARAESYLQRAGATVLLAGPAAPNDPFFFGLYGGSRPAGFLESDPAAAPFFAALGYEPAERIGIYQRDLSRQTDPMSMRLMGIRRRMQLCVGATPPNPTWWWITRFGRLDTVRFQLTLRGDEAAVAAITVVGLDLYLPKWQERAIGMADLHVASAERRQGYAQALILEVCRRMREELVTRVEGHASEAEPHVMALLQSVGFQRVDTGVVYRKSI